MNGTTLITLISMAHRLQKLEEAEELVIQLLETAGRAIGELKEIQANSKDKNDSLLMLTNDYYSKLSSIKEIVLSEIRSQENSETTTVYTPEIDNLAIAEWEAKVIADNLHDLVAHNAE